MRARRGSHGHAVCAAGFGEFMSTSPCEREEEVLEAVACGRWADALNGPLRRHAANCLACAEVVLVAGYLREEKDSAKREAVLPSAGLIWWKAQLLAKREAVERAAQPIAMVGWASCALGVLSLVGVAIWQRSRLASWVARWPDPWRLADRWPINGFSLRDFLAGLWSQTPNTILIVSVSACLLLAAFVVYVVWAEE